MFGISTLPDDDAQREPPSAEARREVEALGALLGVPTEPEPPTEPKPPADAPEPEDPP